MTTPLPLVSTLTVLRIARLFLPVLTFLPLSALADTFYVSPSGSDSNPGTQAAPFGSITQAQAVASSGDIVFLRGGTYNNFIIAGSDSNYNFVHNITKSGITYAAVSGETPIFDFSNITTVKRVAAFHIAKGVTGVVFRGFQVTGVPVGSQKQSECFRIEGAATFEVVTCHDNAANGFYFTTNGSGACTNCDSFNNIGSTSASIGNTDGFGAHALGVVFTGCRSWHNSDDGFDCISSTLSNTFDHCWAYNMTAGGDSNGFKVGGYGLTGAVANPMPSHIVRFCLSANNNAHGFYANHQPGKSATWTNNTAYNNRNANFDMLEQVSATDRTDIPGTREILHNNLAFTGTIIIQDNNPPENTTENSWTKSGVTVSAEDFKSLDATQMTLPRPPDGSLPSITFMHLAAGSDLAGLGCFIDSANIAPTVSLSSPADGAPFVAGDAITINVAAADSDGMVNKVDFYQGSTLLATTTSAPYTFTWNNVAAGTYSLSAVATDDRGATTTSSAVTIIVTSAPMTYQAEDGIVAGGVTIDHNNDGFNGTGFANFPASGGTLAFSNVSGNGGGTKRLAIRYANGAATARLGALTVNGITSSIAFPSTGNWTTWSVLNVTIALGNNSSNTIRLASTGSDLGNIDQITVP